MKVRPLIVPLLALVGVAGLQLSPPAHAVGATYVRVKTPMPTDFGDDQNGDSSKRTAQSVSMSPDGRFVVFTGTPEPAAQRADGSLPPVQVFLLDRKTARTEMVSVNDAGQPLNGDGATGMYAFESTVGVSNDGRYVVWAADSDNVAPYHVHGQRDVMLRDRLRRRTTVVASDALRPSMSGDGRVIGFERCTVSADGFACYRKSSPMLAVRRSATAPWKQILLGPEEGIEQGRGAVKVSNDGRFAAFAGLASDTAPTCGHDVYVYDVAAARTTGVSTGLPKTQPRQDAGVTDTSVQACQTSGYLYPSISADGAAIAFELANHYGGWWYVNSLYVWSKATRTATQVAPRAGLENVVDAEYPTLSADGRWLVYWGRDPEGLAKDPAAISSDPAPDIGKGYGWQRLDLRAAAGAPGASQTLRWADGYGFALANGASTFAFFTKAALDPKDTNADANHDGYDLYLRIE
jgi:Tol biopolymer transport system component